MTLYGPVHRYRRLQISELSAPTRKGADEKLTMSNVPMCQNNAIRTFFDFLIMYIIGIYYTFRELCSRHNLPTGVEGKCGHVAIVTGGARGIGLEVVRQFLKEGMHVIIGSSNSSSGDNQVKQLKLEFPGSTVEFQKLDLSSLNSIKEFATHFLEQNLPLHVLVNNAGIMFGPYATTEDGFESQLGVNYIGHFYLTYLLLPQLCKTGTSATNARIVNVSSCGHFAGRIKISDLNSREFYSPYGCYGQSKLAQVMFTKLLQEYLNGHQCNVTVSVVHPGVVNTELYKHTVFKFLPLLVRLFFKSPKQGADCIVHVALSNKLEGIGGSFFENCQQAVSSKTSEDKFMQQQLWQETCQLLKIDDFHPPLFT